MGFSELQEVHVQGAPDSNVWTCRASLQASEVAAPPKTERLI